MISIIPRRILYPFLISQPISPRSSALSAYPLACRGADGPPLRESSREPPGPALPARPAQARQPPGAKPSGRRERTPGAPGRALLSGPGKGPGTHQWPMRGGLRARARTGPAPSACLGGRRQCPGRSAPLLPDPRHCRRIPAPPLRGSSPSLWGPAQPARPPPQRANPPF